MKLIQTALILFCAGFSSAFAQGLGNPSTLDDFQISSHYTQPESENKLNLDLPSFTTEKALLVANVAGTTAAGIGVLKWDPHQDKVRHFLAGYVAGNVTNGALQLLLPEDMKNRRLFSTLMGIGASILAGIGKEVWDSMGHGTVDAKDVYATAAGGVVGSITISFDLEKAFL